MYGVQKFSLFCSDSLAPNVPLCYAPQQGYRWSLYIFNQERFKGADLCSYAYKRTCSWYIYQLSHGRLAPNHGQHNLSTDSESPCNRIWIITRTILFFFPFFLLLLQFFPFTIPQISSRFLLLITLTSSGNKDNGISITYCIFLLIF